MANMVFDSDDPGDPMAQGASPITWTHTNSGTPTIGIVCIQVSAFDTGFGDVSAVTWDGEGMDSEGSEEISWESDPIGDPGALNYFKVWIYTIQDPGTGTVSVTHNDIGAGIWSAGSVAYTGGGVRVDFQTATINFPGPDTQTISINLSGSDADGVSVDSQIGGNLVQGSGQAELMARPFFGRMSHTVGGATPFNPTMSWRVSAGSGASGVCALAGILFVDAAEGIAIVGDSLPGEEPGAPGASSPFHGSFNPFPMYPMNAFSYNVFKTTLELQKLLKNIKVI